MTRLIWFDALTSKQFLIAVSLKEYLSSKGFGVLITARRYDAIEGLARILRADAVIVGGYGGDPYSKLKEEVARMSRLLEVLEPRFGEIVAGVSYPNPAEARIMYGLGKPLVVLSDTPHAVHAHMLTVPLASHLVYSECIEEHEWSPYLLPHTKATRYRGVDELSWIYYLKGVFDVEHIRALGLSEREYVAIRPEESKASYYTWGSRRELWFKVIERILSIGLKIVFLPRYEDQRRHVEERYRRHIERGELVIPSVEKAVGPSIAKHSLAVITGGGTMAREAALYGVPGITLFPLELSVDRCLASRGAPIYRARDLGDVMGIVENAAKNPEAFAEKARSAVEGMEPPHDTIYKILRGLSR